MQQVDDFEARIGWIPVDGGDRAEADEGLLVFKITAHLERSRRRDEKRRLVALVVAVR